jgi:hypothetical protein
VVAAASGACEAVTQALTKHISDDLMTTQSTARAVGSLAFKDEGNQARLHASGACAAIVTALRSHGQVPRTPPPEAPLHLFLTSLSPALLLHLAIMPRLSFLFSLPL